MNKAVNQLRLFLCTFSGEDDFIIRKCSIGIQVFFAFIGLFVITIFIGCFISAAAFTYSIFDENPMISTPFGVFWASMIIIIYLLLLYTITPPTLPNNYKNNKGTVAKINTTNRFFTLSMLLRMGFILLLAIIIAQPLNVYFLSNSTATSIDKFKQEQKARMIIVSDSLLIQNEIRLSKDFENQVLLKSKSGKYSSIRNEMLIIDSKISEDTSFVVIASDLLDSINKIDKGSFLNKTQIKSRDSLVLLLTTHVEQEIASDYQFKNDVNSITCSNENLKEDFETYKANLVSVIDSKIDNYQKLDKLLNKSNFYLQKISILFKENPISWLISLLICILFLIPIYLKFIVRNTSEFYDRKEEIEKKLVVDHYQEFKHNYSRILGVKVAEYNKKHKTEVLQALSKIKNINPLQFKQYLVEIDTEYKDEPIIKYEHWSDCPFKTQKKSINRSISNDEKSLLELLYSNSEE